jgi:hypothetical protein
LSYLEVFLMKRSLAVSGFVAVVVGLGLLGVAQQARGQTSSKPHPSKTSSSKTQSFTVVQIGDEYKVINSSSLADEKKRVNDDNKKKRDEWEDERKADPSLKRPVTLVVKVIKSGFKTQKGADEFVVKLKEKDKEEGKDAKDAKDGKTPDGKRPTY